GIKKDAKEKFLSLSNHDRSKYFMNLLNEIADKVPVRRSRLSTNERFQYINYGKPEEQIIFSIKINVKSQDLDENTVDSVVLDIYTMITYKQITTFFNGLTNDLDASYGFEVMEKIIEAFMKFCESIKEFFGGIINFVTGIKEKIFGVIEGMYYTMATYAKLEDDQPSIENIKDLVIISIVKDPDQPSSNDKEQDKDKNSEQNKYYEIIGEVVKENKHDCVHIITNTFEHSDKLKEIFDGKKVEISNQIKSEVKNIPSILKRISEDQHESSCSDDLNNINSEDIDIEIQPTTKLLHVFIKIHHEFHKKKRKLILAEIHIGFSVLILEKLFGILLDQFFVLLENKILTTIEEKISIIKNSKKISIRDKEFEKKLATVAGEIKKEIFNHFQHFKPQDLNNNEIIIDGQEVSNIQANNSTEISKEIKYKILNKFYKKISNMQETHNDIFDVQKTSNEANEEQSFTEITDQIQRTIQKEYFLKRIYDKIYSELEIYDGKITLIEKQKQETSDHEKQEKEAIDQIQEWTKNYLIEILNKIYEEETFKEKQNKTSNGEENPSKEQNYTKISIEIKKKISDEIHRRIEKEYFYEILEKIYKEEDNTQEDNKQEDNKTEENKQEDNKIEKNKLLNQETNKILENNEPFEK
ncbi:23368_t:CDS:2, partial [Racocetra persica]